jgi:hypothetical protein
VTFSPKFSYQFALLVVLCTIALLFFPVVQGPYSAVHGPATALLSLKAKTLLCLALLLAAMHLLARYIAVCHVAPGILVDGTSLPASRDFEHTAVLRC